MSRLFKRLATAALAIAILTGNNVPRVSADSLTFEFAEPIDLGSNLNRIGSLEWSHILGTEWDTNFQLGGFVGAQNAVVIPEVRILDTVIIPQVAADTRTGLRMAGRASGSTGLEFYANFNASGLDAGASFEFQPKIVDLPSQVQDYANAS